MKIVMTGIAKIDRDLRELGPKAARKVVVGAMRAAMKETIAPEVEALAPEGETGALRRSVKVRAGKRSRKGVRMFVLIDPGSLGGEKWYAVFKELGTRIMKAAQFMRRAYRGRANAARDLAIKKILAGLESIAGR